MDRFQGMRRSQQLRNSLPSGWGFFLFIVFLLPLGSCKNSQESDTKDLGQPYSEANRIKRDIRLFNEINIRNRAWPGHTRRMRYEIIEKMSNEGYELATLALKLLDFRLEDWDVSFDDSAYQRLKNLASLGDASSMCMFVEVNRKWQRESQLVIDEYIRNAAKQGNSACMVYKAGQLQRAGRKDEAHKMRLSAARAGSHFMQLRLAQLYGQGRLGYLKSLGKAKCWLEVAQNSKFDTGESLVVLPQLNRWTMIAKKDGRSDSMIYSQDSWCDDLIQQSEKNRE